MPQLRRKGEARRQLEAGRLGDEGEVRCRRKVSQLRRDGKGCRLREARRILDVGGARRWLGGQELRHEREELSSPYVQQLRGEWEERHRPEVQELRRDGKG